MIGSLQRRTRIDPVDGLKDFDIDILAQLGSFVAWLQPPARITCDSALDAVEETIRGSLIYRRMGPHDDNPAIVIPYSDGTRVEVVPAYRNQMPGTTGFGRSYWIPHAGAWRAADYDFDARWISLANELTAGRLVPAIKMLKAWRREHCAEMRSYHLEVLAAHAVAPIVGYARQMRRAPPWPALMAGTFAQMATSAKSVAVVPGSASEPADNYVTAPIRQRITATLQATTELAGMVNNIEAQSNSRSLEAWRAIFGAPFPA